MGRLTLAGARQRLRRKRVTPTTWQQQNRQVTEEGKPMASSLSRPQNPALVQAAPADGTRRCPSLHQPPLHRAHRHPEPQFAASRKRPPGLYGQPGQKMAPARRQRTQRLPGQKEAEARHKTPGPQGGAAGAKESVDGAGAAEARRSRGKGERASRPQEEKQQTKLKSRNIC